MSEFNSDNSNNNITLDDDSITEQPGKRIDIYLVVDYLHETPIGLGSWRPPEWFEGRQHGASREM